MSTAIIDTYAWIEFLIDGGHAASVREVLLESERIVTPDLVLGELGRKLHREGMANERVQGCLLEIIGLSGVVPIDLKTALGVHTADLALRANARKHRLGLSGLSDAVVLATARVLGGQVVTGDPHFRGLPETLWVG